MNTEGGIRRLEKDEKLKAEEKLVPKRFAKDAAAMLAEGKVPSPTFAKYAQKARRASAARKRKRQLAQASKRRNR